MLCGGRAIGYTSVKDKAVVREKSTGRDEVKRREAEGNAKAQLTWGYVQHGAVGSYPDLIPEFEVEALSH